GELSYNIETEDRSEVLDKLYKGDGDIGELESESANNILERYNDIEENFPDSLKGEVLPFFTDWLLKHVEMVQIIAYDEGDAYSIFETINDRGLSLTPSDMLKGYLISNLEDKKQKEKINVIWKKQILDLIEVDGDDYSDFFKSWLRAKYAETMRKRAKGALNKDFEIIGTSFHKWVRDKRKRLGLNNSEDYHRFIKKDYVFFSKRYVEISNADINFNKRMEYVYYNAWHNFTLQYPLILAPITPNDSPDEIRVKMRLVSRFVDMFIALRGMNSRKWGYSSVSYSIFTLVKKIRDLNPDDLAKELEKEADSIQEKFKYFSSFRLHQQNRSFVHYFLARLTANLDKILGHKTDFEHYTTKDVDAPFEIEHIIPNKWNRYEDEFSKEEDFEYYRNLVGSLILIPRGFNQSYGDAEYEVKLDYYFGQNPLAQSLHPKFYNKNPRFLRYLTKTQLPFEPHEEFLKKEIKKRQKLYEKLARKIWSAKVFKKELDKWSEK
ncbi:MAG: GmrSD restriction endonuclease domain-containing protein, partial [Candidatus Thorarchaeota archaeon]